MKKHVLGAVWLFCATLVAAAYTNCSKVNQGSSQDSSTVPKNNGDFYTGKVYAVAGACADGSTIRARMRFVTNDDGEMLRENCADLAQPRPIPAASIVKPADRATVIVEGQTMVYQPASLAADSGFENGFASWQVLGGAPQITADAYAGTSAVTTLATSDWSWVQQGIDPVLLTPGKRYTLRAAGKISGGAQPLRIQYRVEGNVVLGELLFTSTTYEVKEVTFEWAQAYTWSVLTAEMVNPVGEANTATFDEMSVFEAP